SSYILALQLSVLPDYLRWNRKIKVPKAPVSGLNGDSVSLPCTVSKSIDAKKFEVRWYRPSMYSTPVLLYKSGQIVEISAKHQGRVSFLGALEKGDVSLKLDNLTVADEGLYICQVSSDSWYEMSNMSLKIRAVGSIPILSVAHAEEGQVNVSCHSHGWLPKPSLNWRDGTGRELKHQSKDTFSKGNPVLMLFVIFSVTFSQIADLQCPSHSKCGQSVFETQNDLTLTQHCCTLVSMYCKIIKHSSVSAVNLTIDPKENPQFLMISGKSICCSDLEDINDEEKIFALCKEAFSSGKHYWEVKVMERNEEKLSWYVGVASEEAERMYKVPLTPANGFWVLCYEKEPEEHCGVYSVNIKMPEQLKTGSKKISTLGVFVDCDNCTVSFYDTDRKSLIYTFTNLRPGKSLYPLISPGIRDRFRITVC
uniref:Ig-like domain-containing protein n=1 Tax=Pygocentrus nattereri TaxID=42514 RepID=A0A3B4CQN3_PYGNA